MMAAIHQGLKDVKRRAMMMVGRAVLSAIDDTTKAQSLQIELLDGETQADVERFQQFGYTSVPFPGAEGVMVSVGGLRSHGIIIAVEDRRYRLTGLMPGESAQYDDQGQKVHLTRDGIVITSPKKITINSAVEVDVTAPVVNFGGEGGQGVARLGDQVTVGGSIGAITSASATVKST